MGIRRGGMGVGLISVLFMVMIYLGLNLDMAQGAVYKDIDSNNADQSYITYLSRKGIITGYPDGSFKPQEGLTRAQAAVVMAKAGQIKIDPNAVSSFKDVKTEHWARPYIAAAVEAGYISGYPDGTFKPDQNLSRAEGISLILRISKQPLTATLPDLEDINNQHWAAKAVAVGLASGMVGISNDNQQFLPNAAFTRINMVYAMGILFSEDPGLYASSLPGKIKPIQGKTTIIKAGSQKEEELKETTAVTVGDSIITEKGANAELNYPDGSSILLNEETRLSIKEAQGRKYIKTNGEEGIAVDWLNLDMKQGTMFTGLATQHETEGTSSPNPKTTGSKNKTIAGLKSLKYIAAVTQGSNSSMPWYEASKTKKVKVKVDMPWGVAAVRGTFVMITVAPGGQADISCLTGNAEVSNAGQTVPLGQNQSTQVLAQTAPPPAPAPMSPAAIEQFAQVQAWLHQTALTMDQNQEQIPPPPPAAVQGPVQQTVVQNSSPTANTGVAVWAVNNALGAIGIGGNAQGIQNNNLPGSSSGSSGTPTVVENPMGQAIPVTTGTPLNFTGGVKIDLGIMAVPAGATVKVETVSPTQLVSSDLQVAGAILNIKFENMSITEPVEISLPVTPGIDASKAGIYYYNNGVWEYQTCRLENGLLKANVSHFSIYGVLLDTSAPTNVCVQSGSITTNSIELILSAQDNIGNNGIKSYAIYRDGQFLTATIEARYIDRNLESDHEYHYSIQAFDLFNNESAASQEITIRTISETATSDIVLTLTNPTEQGNSIAVGGATREGTVNVVNGTDSLMITANKTSAQTITVGGHDNNLVTAGGADNSPTYTVDTSSIAATGGTKLFTLTVSENGKTSIVYTVTVVVAAPAVGNFEGDIINAVNGNHVPAITISFREGADNTTGNIVATVVTDDFGHYRAEGLPQGTYTGQTSGTGFNTATFNAICTAGTTMTGQDATISPVLEEGETRIVLTWGESPEDLDSHLTGPTGDLAFRFHTFFDNKDYNYNQIKYVSLDLDDTDSCGPETTTIYHQSSGDYIFSVHKFSEDSSLASSQAQVKVYKGSQSVASYTVPDQAGRWWTVFKMNGNTITPINQIFDIFEAGAEAATADISLELSTPATEGENSIGVGGEAKTGNVNVVNGTNSVVITATKTADQTVVIGGTEAGLVTEGGAGINPTYTVNTSSIAATGGNVVFTLTVNENGKTSIVYNVIVVVGAPTITGVTGTINIENPSYQVGDVVNIIVADADRNTNTGSIQTVSVCLKSTGDNNGITVSLTETGENTGIFEGSAQLKKITNPSQMQLSAAVGNTITAIYHDGLSANGSEIDITDTATVVKGITGSINISKDNSTITVTLADADLNIDPNNKETININAKSSTTDTDGITVVLTETGNNTGQFSGTFLIGPATDMNTTPLILGATSSEIIVITYHDNLDDDGVQRAITSEYTVVE